MGWQRVHNNMETITFKIVNNGDKRADPNNYGNGGNNSNNYGLGV